MDTTLQRIEVLGMTCAHRGRAVTEAAGTVPGASRPQVELATGILSWHGSADRSAIRAALERDGFGTAK
nr:heavy metal-associated domain-containing protein [uncultured Lichenicoccus sp.]